MSEKIEQMEVEPEIVIQELTERIEVLTQHINILTEENKDLKNALSEALETMKNANGLIKIILEYKMLDISKMPGDQIDEFNGLLSEMIATGRFGRKKVVG